MGRPDESERLRVLVVDDCPDTTWSMALLLRLWGHDVSVAANGQAALSMAEVFRPQVVLLDIGLPVVDGLEVARRLRQQPDLFDVLILGISGFSQPEDTQRALEAGCDHYLIKPVEPDALRSLLASMGKLTR
jgi:two-component system CheB/CheR fusion protein